jgi:hypothetical protein
MDRTTELNTIFFPFLMGSPFGRTVPSSGRTSPNSAIVVQVVNNYAQLLHVALSRTSLTVLHPDQMAKKKVG